MRSWVFIRKSFLARCFRPVDDKSIRNDGNDTSSSTFDSKADLVKHNFNHSRSVIKFDMAELIRMTSNFSPSQLIGQGGFGAVYKGKLKDGTVVAVKRAKKNNIEVRVSAEFKSEVQMLGNVEHLNLVKLIGYLEQEKERIIVVEYVPNGNLRQHLDVQHAVVLNMAVRLDIAIDVAHALTYLHLYADAPIIHRDIKASNILLTSTFRAKVADFGFSRIGPLEMDATHVSTQVKGTAGYVDPEYLHTYQLTDKSDVYSFGILLVEIVTGRRPIELMRQGDERVTVRWVYRKYTAGILGEVLDPKLAISPECYLIVERIVELAMHCVAPKKEERPPMKEVSKILWNIRRDHKSALQRLIEKESPSSGYYSSRSNSQSTHAAATF